MILSMPSTTYHKVENEAYENSRKELNYFEIIKCLTNNQEKRKINHEGQAVSFKAKGLLYIPRCGITSSP